MRTLHRYLLLQVPGWALVLLALLWARRSAGLPDWAAAGLLLLWIAKDLVLYPWLRVAYQGGGGSQLDALLGCEGVARDRLEPSGYVRLGAELWRAESVAGPIPAGSRVRVTAARGLTLSVEPAREG